MDESSQFPATQDIGDGHRAQVGVGLGGDRRVPNRYHEYPDSSKLGRLGRMPEASGTQPV
jgi:hypothetical protein